MRHAPAVTGNWVSFLAVTVTRCAAAPVNPALSFRNARIDVAPDTSQSLAASTAATASDTLAANRSDNHNTSTNASGSTGTSNPSTASANAAAAANMPQAYTRS